MSRSNAEDVDLPSSEHPRKSKRMKMISPEEDEVVEKMEVDVSSEVVMASRITSLASTSFHCKSKTVGSTCTRSTTKSSSSSSPSSRDESTFQKVNKLQEYVPYSAQLIATREELWANLQKHLFTAIASQGQPLQEWIHACEQ